jgi:hypothetical protein
MSSNAWNWFAGVVGGCRLVFGERSGARKAALISSGGGCSGAGRRLRARLVIFANIVR